jgi:hypothetical protein
MIRYALVCEHAHGFEAWFGSSGDYDDQRARGLVECPFCASREVRKQIMSPAVAGTKARGAVASPLSSPPEDARKRAVMMEAMSKVRAHVESTFDYVGDSFAREARAIHEGRSEERGIYGEASPREVKALVEDGVKVAPLPPAATPRPKTEVN